MFSRTGLSICWEWRNNPLDEILTEDSFRFSICYLKLVSVLDWTNEYWLESSGVKSPCSSHVDFWVWPIFSESKIACYSSRIACWLSKNCLFKRCCYCSSRNFLRVSFYFKPWVDPCTSPLLSLLMNLLFWIEKFLWPCLIDAGDLWYCLELLLRFLWSNNLSLRDF